MVMDRFSGSLTHSSFNCIGEYLSAGDCLVINDTKVIPARLIGEDKNGAATELLLLNRYDGDTWVTLVKPGKRARVGADIVFGGGKLTGHVDKITEDGNRLVTFRYTGIFAEILEELGQMPLPPYIKEKLSDRDRYQTVYASHEGSAAAPTAGLHFSDDLLMTLEKKGIRIARITLHVGLGTFRPVRTEDITEHHMHSELYNIEQSQADIVNNAKRAGKKVIAVGTTSTRTLEANYINGLLKAGQGWTDIFIYPGYEFKCVDALITNFHLPESTLIMLVSAFCGRENTLEAYRTAVSMSYRFFSFGDAMLIV